MSISILSETDLRKVIKLDLDTIDCVENAFVALAGGEVVMPPVLSMEIADSRGEVDVKTAYMPGLECFAIKVSPGFFDNPKVGLPSTSGLMILFSVRTGVVAAVLLDNGYLTDIRTAAAGGVAARHLARKDARTACIVGAGAQARLQLEALALVLPLQRATVWARDTAKAEKAAQEMSDRLEFEVSAAPDIEAAVKAADVIVTTTPADKPLIRAEWLQPGQHVTAMGSDQHNKSELYPDCIAKADCYVPDRQSQTAVMGELRSALEAGVISSDAKFSELGTIAAGKAAGRMDDTAITIADLTGTGVQDTAIANLARERAMSAGAGTEIPN